MDFLILMLVSKVSKLRTSVVRIIMGGIIGAAGACFIMVCSELQTVLRNIIAYIVLSILMIRVSYGIHGIRNQLNICLAFYVVACFLGGMLTFIFFNTDITKYLNQLLGITPKQSVRLYMIVIAIGIIVLGTTYVIHYINGFRNRVTNIFEVAIQLEDKTVVTKGLLDTGNHLREPISGKPVIIVEKELINELLTKELMEYTTRLKVIPYRSIGKDHGTMYGIVLDRISVDVNEEKHEHKNVVACLYEGTLSSKKDYQLILHEELL